MPPDAEAAYAVEVGDRAIDDVLESRVEVVRGATGFSARRIAYRALSAATMPILMQIVEGVFG
jgi:hypothetical protein